LTVLTTSPSWHQLAAHHARIKDIHLRTLFAEDPGRAERFVAEGAGLFLDYSKNRITDETLALLLRLAEERGVTARRDAMFAGEKINVTERRAVLHIALRAPRGVRIDVDGADVVPDVHRVLDAMAAFAARVRDGRFTGITVVEVAIDEGSIEVGSASEPVSEVELELKGGRIGPMFRLAAELQTLAPLWISPESKSVRGWHLRTGQTEGAQKALVPHLGRHALAAAGFQEIIDLKLGHVMANIGPTLRGDPEGVHQVRIAIRGSRAALKLFERHLDVAAAGRFDAGLRRFGLIFGTARDWDVFYLETLPAAMADLSAERLWDLSPPAEIERQAAHAAVEKALRGPEFTGLLLGIAVWAGAGVIQPGTLGDRRMGKRLGRLAPSLLERVAGKAKKRGQHAGRLSAEGLHRLRKACKKLLYDVESLSGLYSDRAVKIYLGQCEELGAVLGGATDAVVTQRLALKLVTESRPDLARPANALARWSARRRRGMLHGLKGEMKEFRDAPDFWS
jgi:inorganic triphosphatase YgiF